MSRIRELFMRIRGTFSSDGADAEAREEFESHLAMQTAENMRRGMSAEDAHQQALNASGGFTSATELVREQRGLPFVETLMADIRYGARALLRSPGYTIVAATTLALGIGANSAIFSVVNGVVFRPLPYDNPDRLLYLTSTLDTRRMSVSVPDFIDWRTQARSFSELSAGVSGTTVLTGSGEPERFSQSRISANALETLGIAPVAGRGFAGGEDDVSAPRVAMLSERLWKRRFGRDQAVIGRTLVLDGMATTIIGIAPDALQWPEKSDVWTTTRFSERDRAPGARGARWIEVVGRLAPQVTPGTAATEMSTIAGRLAQFDPKHNTNVGARVKPLLASLIGDVRAPLYVLLGSVGCVLLIACANVASLTLGRVNVRDTELAIRTALGAARGRIVRQILTESFLLAVVGGALGVLVGIAGIKALIAFAPSSLPRVDSIALDGRVLAFTFGVTILTAIIFGLMPALQGATDNLHDRLRAAGRGVRGHKVSSRARRTLAVGEMALAIVLLIGAGLLLRSFAALRMVDPGFHAANVETFNVALPAGDAYRNPDQLNQFSSSLLAGIDHVSGVKSSAISFSLPLSGGSFGFTFEVRDRPTPPADNEPRAQARVASPAYFESMSIPLLQGRSFNANDRYDAPPVLLISREVARRYFPNENPIGKYIETGWGMNGRKFGGEVVGIVGDVRQRSLDQEKSPHIYMSYQQWPLDEFDVVVLSASSSANAIPGARRVLKELDSQVPLNAARSLSDLVDASLGQRRYFLMLLASFAALAVTLAIVGVYGVISYGVQQRHREIGIRLALGASRQSVVRMVLAEGLKLVAASVVTGTLGALGLTRLLSSLLFQIDAHDPLIFTLAPTLLSLVAVLACVIPARAAARNNPVEVIRAE
ncbi:MAG: ABC transporter permease [Gemmatimonas sp.]